MARAPITHYLPLRKLQLNVAKLLPSSLIAKVHVICEAIRLMLLICNTYIVIVLNVEIHLYVLLSCVMEAIERDLMTSKY